MRVCVRACVRACVLCLLRVSEKETGSPKSAVHMVFVSAFFSGSMEPAFYRGDLLFLTNYQNDPIAVGEIVVFKVKGRDIPIVHRVIKSHRK